MRQLGSPGPSPTPPVPCAPPPPGMAAPIVGPPFAPGPPPSRLLVSVAVLSPAFGDADARLLLASPPKPNVRLTVRLTDSEPGPCPKFRGMICSPGLGTRLKFPNRVQRMLILVQSAL